MRNVMFVFVLHCISEDFPISLIFITKGHRPKLSQTMNSVRSNNRCLKYQRFTSSGSKDIGVRKLSLWQRLNSVVKCILISIVWVSVIVCYLSPSAASNCLKFVCKKPSVIRHSV